MEKEMRRKDRVMPPEDIERVLKENSHGVLATVSADGTPYANPISYVYHDGRIYFHSASQGHKVENMAHNPAVAFTVIGQVRMKGVPKADAYFESVIVFGKASIVTDFDEQVASMTELVRVFMPGQEYDTPDDLRKMQKAVHVYRIDIGRKTGKLRKPAG
ncbi:MAG: pyridoxamine 5'-phosphate oxidase family protein [Lachnospiraceae bacterium]|jgi:nitroimidazol reductase NimA-like FMN-containing flavoprotein (pyridoxamine 5'-phosphate oxidase superfamily)|nr:pyridoxamine 5'-phosphate oxidase family protein [Lachnospiraceae bacterium]